MTRFVLLLFVLSWAPPAARADALMEVRRPATVLRTGPGSFYPVLAELSQGLSLAVRDTSGGWLHVRVDSLDGYVSRKAVAERAQASGAFDRMGAARTGLTVSRHGLSAGIKGFAERCAHRLSADPETLDALLRAVPDAGAQERFRQETYGRDDVEAVRRRVPLPGRDAEAFFTFSEQGMGLAIAARIAGQGLCMDPGLTAYVDHVGQLLVEASDAYDVSFRFLVLDVPTPTAVSCPGGTVFVTTGMLRTARSEAELAGVLSHEIAHVSRCHGMQEMEKRKVQIIADDAFAELGEAVDVEGDTLLEVERELDDMALEIYERLVADRLVEYEIEADRLGMVFAARAGYEPRALVDLLTRLSADGATTTDSHYAPQHMTRRLAEARGEAGRLPGGLRDGTARYRRATSGL